MSSLTQTFQHFLERIISDAMEEIDDEVSIGGRISICGLPMASMLLREKNKS